MTHDQMLATLTLLGWERVGTVDDQNAINRWRNCGRDQIQIMYRWQGPLAWATVRLPPWFKGLPTIEPTEEEVASAFKYIVKGQR